MVKKQADKNYLYIPHHHSSLTNRYATCHSSIADPIVYLHVQIVVWMPERRIDDAKRWNFFI